MAKFKYERPKGSHYKIAINKWNDKFSKRGRYPFVIANVYIDGDTAIVHYNISVFGKGFFLLLSPLYYITHIFMYGFTDAHEAFLSVIFDKKLGKYGVDAVYRKDTLQWLKLMSLIGRDKIDLKLSVKIRLWWLSKFGKDLDKYHDSSTCNKCGGENVIEVTEVVAGGVGECSTACKECGFEDYWAYGKFNSIVDGYNKCRKY